MEAMNVRRNRFDRWSWRIALLLAACVVGLIAGVIVWPESGARLSELTSGGEAAGAGTPMYLVQGGTWVIDDVAYFSPGARLRSYFPSNPRGYFLEDDFAARGGTQLLETVRLSVSGEARARREVVIGDRFAFHRVTFDRINTNAPWQALLAFPAFHLQSGQQVEVALEARADAARTVTAVLAGDAPGAAMPAHEAVRLSESWQSIKVAFAKAPTTTNAQLCLNLADDPSKVEIGDVSIVVERQLVYRISPDDRPAFFVEYQLNNAGFRGGDFEPTATGGTWRIAVLGDSYTFGQGVHDRDLFTTRLEQALNARTPKPAGAERFEVMNFGISGLSTLEERRLYEQTASRYRPQVVLVVMCDNDNVTVEDSHGLHLRYGGGAALLEAEQALTESRGYENCAVELRHLHATCREQDIALAVFVFATSRHGSWRRLHDAVAKELDPLGVPVLSIRDALARQGLLGKVDVHPGDGHPNEIAHRVAAEEIERFLVRNGLLGDTAQHSLSD